LLHLNQGGAAYSYLYDGKGNVTALLDANANVAKTYQYDPFGRLMAATGDPDLNQPLQFSTKSYDDQTGLSYYGYRFYVPSLGRWLTRDPRGEEEGINLYGFVDSVGKPSFSRTNLYTFVDNNPVWEFDPDGLQPRTPLNGPPNTSVPRPNGGTRNYGPNGKACSDIDPPHPSHNRYWHRHAWKGPNRGPATPLAPLPAPLMPGGSGGGCFIGGTPVNTPNGFKPIETIEIGDIVLSWNEHTLSTETQRVVGVMKAIRRDVVKILINSDELIIASSNHQFYVKGKKWIKAIEVSLNDILIDKKSKEVLIKKIDKTPFSKEAMVYNIEVEKLHNYFVGKAGILTHNRGLKDP